MIGRTSAPTQITCRFTLANGEERPVTPAEASPRLAHASVTDVFDGGIEAATTTCEHAIVYVTEKTGTFTGMEVLAGGLDGRKGAFALEERGSFDAHSTVRCTFTVAPGSGSGSGTGTGTGELTGLRGSGRCTVEPGAPSAPCTYDYDLD
ncbi:DUF3224 domain-containing protein [Kitasatospora sp. NPDC101801]|uniref:DUF3224 domain-containing protein n=1 Tax=Kitasatospora sp. NPDC101801 TaxID=3364103 RepID=UPI003815D287